MTIEMVVTGLSAINTLIAAGIWVRIGRLEGHRDASDTRLGNLERRVSRLEDWARQ